MGSKQLHTFAELAGGAADFIAEYPEAAAFFARKLAAAFRGEACRTEEDERTNREDMKRRGF